MFSLQRLYSLTSDRIKCLLSHTRVLYAHSEQTQCTHWSSTVLGVQGNPYGEWPGYPDSMTTLHRVWLSGWVLLCWHPSNPVQPPLRSLLPHRTIASPLPFLVLTYMSLVFHNKPALWLRCCWLVQDVIIHLHLTETAYNLTYYNILSQCNGVTVSTVSRL